MTDPLVIFTPSGKRGRFPTGTPVLTAARAAFSPDNPGVAIGPVGRFGTMEMTIPRRAPPLAETLCDANGALSNLAQLGDHF